MTREEAIEVYNGLINQKIKEAFEFFAPELAESEDERIRKWLYELIDKMSYDNLTEKERTKNEEWRKKVLAWLEKQKAKEEYDRMLPIYNDRDSFESALEKAWKSYGDSGARTVDSCEDDYVECAHAKGFREGFLYGLEKWKEQKENPKNADSIPADCTSDAKCEDRSQKHNISVDDIAQDYVDGVKEFNPEPTWDLMQTAVCYGYHYREQKEQKPLPLMNGDADLYFDNWNQQHTNPTKRDCFEEGMRYAERLQKEQKPIEYLDKDKIYAIMRKLHDLSFSQDILIDSKEYWKIDEITHDVSSLLEYPIEQKPAEWSEEDEKMLDEILDRVTYAFYNQGLDGEIEDDPVFLWLHKLRPSWKPSEEQMDSLRDTIVQTKGYSYSMYLPELYEQLKKLM